MCLRQISLCFSTPPFPTIYAEPKLQIKTTAKRTVEDACPYRLAGRRKYVQNDGKRTVEDACPYKYTRLACQTFHDCFSNHFTTIGHFTNPFADLFHRALAPRLSLQIYLPTESDFITVVISSIYGFHLPTADFIVRKHPALPYKSLLTCRNQHRKRREPRSRHMINLPFRS